jgi:hypothetical protein
MKLYEITMQYRQALAVLDQADLSDLTPEEQQELVSNTLDDFEDKFQSKALAVGAFVANLELEAESLRTMETRIQQRRKSTERKAEWLKDYVHVQMQAMDLLDIHDNQIRLSIRKNPPKVIIENDDLLPEDYKEVQVNVLIRKTLIADAIKNGDKVPGAYLHYGTRLQIK